MNKLLLLLFLIIPQYLMANDITIKGLNFNYNGEQGSYSSHEIKADSDFMSLSLRDKEYRFFRDHGQDKLIIDLPSNDMISLNKFSESSLKDIQNLKVSSLNLNVKGHSLINLISEQLLYKSQEEGMRLVSPRVVCQDNRDIEGADYLTLCFNSLYLSIPTIISTRGLVNKSFSIQEGTDANIESLIVTIKQGNLKAKLKIKERFSINVKIEGYLNYQKEEQKIIFTLNKAKAAGISIRSKILQEIKEKNMENVKVEGNNIIILL